MLDLPAPSSRTFAGRTASYFLQLAPFTFGLEDGNLIISWPTAAGRTYRVQRSTGLES